MSGHVDRILSLIDEGLLVHVLGPCPVCGAKVEDLPVHEDWHRHLQEMFTAIDGSLDRLESANREG